jgi:ABC-type multidrug transport system fused ATPase/permease subunit
VLAATFFGSACMAAQALIPAAVGRAVDTGIIGRDQRDLIAWGGGVLALGVIQAVTSIMRDRCALTGSLGAAYLTMNLVTRQACRLGATLTKRVSTGEALTVGVGDITQIGGVMNAIDQGVAAVAAVILVSAIMLATSWQLGLLVLLGVPAIAWTTGLSMRPMHHRQARLREQQAELTTRAVDIASGLRVLIGIGGEALFTERFRAAAHRVRDAAVRVAYLDAVLVTIRTLLPGLLVVAVVWLGARDVLSHLITSGQLVAFYAYAVFLTIPLGRLIGVAAQFTSGHVAAGRVVRILAAEPESARGSLERSPGEDIGEDGGVLVDPGSGLVIFPGRMTTVTGAVPADLALIADRLGNYADSDATLGGVALKDLPAADVRRRILVSGNDARLFSGELRAELDPGDRARDNEGALRAAIAVASADDIFQARPDGLAGMIVGSGREFSGGEQQRLRLVRALMADPEILVLVDPTNALDAHTEARVAQRLHACRAGRTTIVFTTSPVMSSHTDRLVLVHNGKVVAEGTHADLLGDDRYRSIVAREGDPA